MQLTHYDSIFETRTFPITLICDGLSSPYNIGGMFRIADAFGLEQIVFLNSDKHIGTRFKKTSRSTEKYVSYRCEEHFQDIYTELLSKGYDFLALEITEKSQALDKLMPLENQPLALIVGGENFGISSSILEKVAKHAHIYMYGTNSSMNVVQSAAIALYELTNRFK